MNVFSLNWWVSVFVSTLVTMCMIFVIKRMSAKFQIPVVSTIAEEV